MYSFLLKRKAGSTIMVSSKKLPRPELDVPVPKIGNPLFFYPPIVNCSITFHVLLLLWDFSVPCAGTRKGNKSGPSAMVDKGRPHTRKAVKYEK